ncbi:MAG: DUF2004 domain-containing protein [Paracoccaceae bacterium]
MSKGDNETTARTKLLELLGTEEGEFGPNLFVSHHKEELGSDYWKGAFGEVDPKPETIVEGLVLVSSWDSEDDGNIDTYDFSLPEGVTDYLLSVRFVGDEVSEVSMES